MNGNETSYVAVAVFFFALGALFSWQVSKTVERFRRALYDFKAAKKGISTLLHIVFKRGRQAIVWSFWGLIVISVGVAALMNQ